MDTKIQTIERQIEQVKKQLLELGEMRPGSLSRQKRDRGGLYHQLSYRHRGKSRTEYVRPKLVPMVRGHIDTYRQFRRLIDRWTTLAIELCRLRMKQENEPPKAQRQKGEGLAPG